MTEPERCAAGLRTIAEPLKAGDHPWYSQIVTNAMVSRAEEILTEDPNTGVRKLTDELATGNFYQKVQSYRVFVWGPLAAGRTVAEHRQRELAPGITTERVALAAAVCAKRNCKLYELCKGQTMLEAIKGGING